jgi:hypothetical protein
MQKPENVAGIWVYPTLPDGMRAATVDDVLDRNGRPRTGTWFIIHSFIYDDYQAYVVKPTFDLAYWRPWLDAGRMWVKENV